MRKLIKFLLAATLVFSLFGCEKPVEKTAEEVQSEFMAMTNQWFIDDVSDDYLSMRFSVKDETALGITDVEVTLGEIDYDAEDENIYAERLAKLKSIDSEKLTATMLRDYEVYVDYYTLYDELFEFEWDYGFLFTPNGGINNNLVTNFTELTLRNEKDVQDFITLLNDVRRYLNDAIEYTKRQAEDGVVQSDATIKDIVSQMEKFVEKVDDNEIIKIATARIDSLNLSNAQDYNEQVIKAVKEVVIPGYQDVIDFYNGIKGKYTSKRIHQYEHGTEYYELLFKVKSSSDYDVAQMKKDLAKAIRENVKLYSRATNNMSEEEYNKWSDDDYDYGYSDPYEILEYLKDSMSLNFPTIPDVSCTISLLDPSVTSENVSAYYLIAPVDDVSENIIRLNPKFAEDDPASTFLYLAHEGYPGHCYEHTYFFANNKTSNLRYNTTYLGTTEAWAKFSEIVVYDYLLENKTELANYLQANKYYNLFSYYLYGYLDILVNYEGASYTEFSEAMSNFGFRASKSLYQTFIGDPLQFIPYSTGLYQIMKMNETFKTSLGDDYSLKQFTTIFLDQGNSSFPIYQKKYDEYIASVKGK